jgi:hypothetical protein
LLSPVDNKSSLQYIVKGGEIDIDGELDPSPPSLFPLDGW